MAPPPIAQPRALFGEPAAVVRIRGVVSYSCGRVGVEGHGLVVAPLRSPAEVAPRVPGSLKEYMVSGSFYGALLLPALAPVRRSSDIT